MDDLPDWNDLPNNPDIRLYYGIAEDHATHYRHALDKLRALTTKYQEECPCTATSAVYTEESDYPRNRMDNGPVFVGRKCDNCKKFTPRREGKPHQVCYKCGEDMLHTLRVRGGDEFIFDFECTACKHKTFYCAGDPHAAGFDYGPESDLLKPSVPIGPLPKV